MSFVESLLGPNASGSFDRLSEEAQRKITREQLGAQGKAIVQEYEPKNVVVRHTYLIGMLLKLPTQVICAADQTKPDAWDSMTAAAVPEQAHILMSSDTLNNELTFTLWLVREQGNWKVQGFWMSISSLADKDSMQLWKLASVQGARGHNFNAALLYAAAAQLANRGPDFKLGITQSISEDRSRLSVPSDIQGQPPFQWKSTGNTFKILSISPIAIGGKIYIIILHEVAPWQTNSQVDGWNRELLAYFKQRFPEYSEVFAGLVIRAKERGTNRLYGTVDTIGANN